ncbi:LOW QUALITY PROTEIN: hypothetical protein CVT25_009655 [Psilocybe cyanescens]|uniref:Uncharacterized protein n=1 Tax=Psilocybe cyanescens TaxID=93625 RepID=A0A409XGZ0_PSICY|nr:LOW QUALITY PROTEIN: hypothetical protein CVT25_009655 [Psilocybe cyanescens]
MADSQVVELPDHTATDPVTPVNANAPPVQHTPVIRKAATQVHSMNVPLSDDAYKLIGGENIGHYLVGITPNEFLEQFLPWNATTSNSYRQQVPDQAKIHALQSVPLRPGQKESHMYPPFVKALDGWVTGADNGQKLRFGHFAKPDSSCVSMNVDGLSWPEGPEPGSCTFSHQQTHEEFKSDHTHDAFKHSSDEGPKNEATAEETVEVAQAVLQEADENPEKANEITDEAEETNEGPSDGTEETPEGVQAQVDEQKEAPASLIEQVEADTQRGIHTRGQIAAYAAGLTTPNVLNSSSTSIFVLFSLPQRGFDTSAVPLDKINEVLPENVAHAFDNYYQISWHKGAKFSHDRSINDEPQKPAKNLPFFRISVEDRTLGKTESFFIPAPVYRHTYLIPFARASRRSLAFLDNPKDGKMCFLKDSWQEVSARTAPEADDQNARMV